MISEETQAYQFAQLRNPSPLEDFLSTLTTVEESAQPHQSPALSSEQIAYKQCLNHIASVIQNASVTSASDVATLNQFLTEQTTNTAPVEDIRIASVSAHDRLQALSLEDCPRVTLIVEEIAQLYEQQSLALSRVLGTPIGSPEQYQAWATYGEAASSWNTKLADLRAIAQEQGLTFSSPEPGSLFNLVF